MGTMFDGCGVYDETGRPLEMVALSVSIEGKTVLDYNKDRGDVFPEDGVFTVQVPPAENRCAAGIEAVATAPSARSGADGLETRVQDAPKTLLQRMKEYFSR